MTYLSHQDGEHTHKTSSTLAESLSDRFHLPIEGLNGKLRRAAHVIVFAVFTILLGLTLRLGGCNLWYLLAVVGWAYIDEATKPFIQGRHFSWLDVGLNLAGAGIGAAIVILVHAIAAM